MISAVIDSSDFEFKLTRMSVAVGPVGMASFMHSGVIPYLQQRIKDRFLSEGDDVTGKWAELMPTTEVFRAAGGFAPSHPINYRTGELFRYITRAGGTVEVDPIMTTLYYPEKGVADGEVSKKLKTAQGGKFNRGYAENTVPRPVIGLGATDALGIITALNFFVTESVMK